MKIENLCSSNIYPTYSYHDIYHQEQRTKLSLYFFPFFVQQKPSPRFTPWDAVRFFATLGGDKEPTPPLRKENRTSSNQTRETQRAGKIDTVCLSVHLQIPNSKHIILNSKHSGYNNVSRHVRCWWGTIRTQGWSLCRAPVRNGKPSTTGTSSGTAEPALCQPTTHPTSGQAWTTARLNVK